jgi:hypothetical protein
LIVFDVCKTDFIMLSGIRPLFHFYDFGIIQNFEAVAAMSKQNNIASVQDATFQILPFRRVEIEPDASALYEEHFLGPFYNTRYRVVRMGCYDVLGRTVHVTELLRKCVGCEKLYTVTPVGVTDDDCQYSIAVSKCFYHGINFCLPSREPAALEANLSFG